MVTLSVVGPTANAFQVPKNMIVTFKSKYGLITLLSHNYTIQDLYNSRATWAVRSCADLQDPCWYGCVQPLELGWQVGECQCDMTSWDSFYIFQGLGLLSCLGFS